MHLCWLSSYLLWNGWWLRKKNNLFDFQSWLTGAWMTIDNSRFLLALVSQSLQSHRSSFSTVTGSAVETGHINSSPWGGRGNSFTTYSSPLPINSIKQSRHGFQCKLWACLFLSHSALIYIGNRMRSLITRTCKEGGNKLTAPVRL